ncbi:hypothetical protein T492DRAFT_839283 [Pavlovales sp. CCMP2436]|nr:hypothetical protein T492DRAFT_839283 [Pavlovales sp. CCMP2436]
MDDAQAEMLRQAETVRNLKQGLTASKSEIDAAIAKLLELKRLLEPLQKAQQAAAAGGSAEDVKKANIAKQEAEKAAARERKKAEKAAKGAGGAEGKPDGAKQPEGAKPEGKKGEAEGGAPKPAAPAPKAAPAKEASAAAAKGSGSGANSNKEFVIKHNPSSQPPVLSFLAAKLAGLPAHFVTQTELGVVCLLPLSHGGGSLSGDETIARYLARLAHPARGILGPPTPSLPTASVKVRPGTDSWEG